MKKYTITLAKNLDEIKECFSLIKEMYAWRGYVVQENMEKFLSPEYTTVIVKDEETIVGTATLKRDSHESPIGSFEIYPEIISGLRYSNALITEVSKLAVDKNIKSRAFNAALFQTIYICAIAKGNTDFVIELNPRHGKYYQSMFGFNMIGGESYCQRVNAPCVLLHAELPKMKDVLKTGDYRNEFNYSLDFTNDELNRISNIMDFKYT